MELEVRCSYEGAADLVCCGYGVGWRKKYGTIDACKWLILGTLITLMYGSIKKR